VFRRRFLRCGDSVSGTDGEWTRDFCSKTHQIGSELGVQGVKV